MLFGGRRSVLRKTVPREQFFSIRTSRPANKIFIYLFIHSFIHSLIHSFIHSFIRSFIHSFIRSFIHSFIHSFIPLFNYTETFVGFACHEFRYYLLAGKMVKFRPLTKPIRLQDYFYLASRAPKKNNYIS